jgi:hypothetical protein
MTAVGREREKVDTPEIARKKWLCFFFQERSFYFIFITFVNLAIYKKMDVNYKSGIIINSFSLVFNNIIYIYYLFFSHCKAK